MVKDMREIDNSIGTGRTESVVRCVLEIPSSNLQNLSSEELGAYLIKTSFPMVFDVCRQLTTTVAALPSRREMGIQRGEISCEVHAGSGGAGGSCTGTFHF